jgi:hypothetical protein
MLPAFHCHWKSMTYGTPELSVVFARTLAAFEHLKGPLDPVPVGVTTNPDDRVVALFAHFPALVRANNSESRSTTGDVRFSGGHTGTLMMVDVTSL